MPTIDHHRKDVPGRSGHTFRIQVEPGQQALAYFELLEDRQEVAHRTIACGEGVRELAIEDVFPEQDLSRSGFLEVTYTIGTGGRVALRAGPQVEAH